ncbi:choline dehydrogenase-like flavoprotein [Dyadobacter jejuensis]|uniref:Choline dehydrogenase-like flavoprotein n=1 Tax=Dyadobacter jejuensis TaxID=1082580 RepID=A0A316ALS6_9BACT|nr:GMC family oxidoreductase [Dyadobacter jejuensis]PWJ58368.1 choline dehydrogenase-like flavoprotein [Dyadobacter jejuensis]
MNLNIKAAKQDTYDAIVVGSGISGGWAAKELTEKGLKVAMLERGRDIEHITGYKTATLAPWEFEHRGRVTTEAKEQYWAGVRTGYTANEEHRYLFENDSENPYKETRGFDWIRAYHVGGRSLLWGRQSYRLNPQDFEANAKDGHGVDWPVRYDEIAPWYDYVEKFAGISGNRDGLDVLPDGQFLAPMQMNCVETHVKGQVEKKFAGRNIIIGRAAHLTSPQNFHTELGRAACQFRNMCMRGCPYGAYFSTQSSTLPAAKKTGNLTLITDTIVSEVIYDDKLGKATGVRTINQNTLETKEYYAKIIFLNASAIASTSILMNSKSSRFPNGMGNDGDQLGRNVMDHHLAVGARGTMDGFEDKYYFGRRANGIYVPRYRNWGNDKRDYVRGFGYQGGASRANWGRGVGMDGFGASFKDSLSEPGGWSMNLGGFGEMLPDEANRFTLHPTEKDKWGLPVVVFDAAYGDNEKKMRQDMMNDAAEMLEAAGLKNVTKYNDETKNPGIGIHEMGTARMGREAKSSVLNGNNQVWGAENVFVTDGSFMTSASCVNPSLTYMAFTARAADFAVKELKKKNL